MQYLIVKGSTGKVSALKVSALKVSALNINSAAKIASLLTPSKGPIAESSGQERQ